MYTLPSNLSKYYKVFYIFHNNKTKKIINISIQDCKNAEKNAQGPIL